MKKAFLVLLVIVCLVVAVWIGYSHFASKTNQVNYEASGPHGVYSAFTLAGDATLEFNDDTLTAYLLPIPGKSVFTYRILEGGTKIQLTDVVSNEVTVYDFKYSEQYDYVVIVWAGGNSFTYWK
jgi:hypothetical protein